MKLSDYIDQRLVWVLDKAESRDQLLRDLCQRIADAEPQLDAGGLYEALLAREEQGATATAECVALPHAMVAQAERTLLAAALVRGGVDFKSQRTGSVDLVFVLVGPTGGGWEHLRLLARLARICHTPGALDRLRASKDGAQLYERLLEEDQHHV